ncbi:transcriptional regulator%2C y4mF family [Yersinia frederiksenii]|uniref:Helix-turn-helix domain-containing protein n=1 Tax=Yersinia alsatica TaxID=2890317 RepID=A0ABY5UQT5_9GAMM|nr:helix-turn-helix transcriptional regulator [Yersinia alsatica]OVZ94488.1 transcriptional regulator [Yersinia frederiksenii]OWF67358.1 transcriptional regulator [Yersinia frederiksenii]OWF79603.1 transcriptional regulator [Yersinia frederiksenii]UWM45729.1 helix-turn-helix domain-containing protein [Yersinia alsatica]CFQ59916.1 transcriptional regulator%2C y4mF family [Yersinia frederiksenii]
MPKSIVRTYSRYTEEALQLLATSVRAARLEKKLTAEEVAERAGISRSLLQRIEKADPRCGIGVVFEVAKIVGVSLFEEEADMSTMIIHRKRIEEKLSLLPRRSRKITRKVNDDF